ncbi:MAG: hypothetical protein ACRELC_04730, partial [Gemmatimonadota bacterium]
MSAVRTGLVYLSLAIPAAACVPGRVCAQAAGEDPAVRTTFEWPDHLRMRVRLTTLDIREREGDADTARTIVTYRLHAAEHPEGRLVTMGDLAVEAMSPGGSAADSLLALVEAFRPALVVSASGELLRIEDEAALEGRADAVFSLDSEALAVRAP